VPTCSLKLRANTICRLMRKQLKQVNWLMVLSHLEIVNALGALEERMALAQYNKFHEGIEKYKRRRRWF
jgi:hypothetical protein